MSYEKEKKEWWEKLNNHKKLEVPITENLNFDPGSYNEKFFETYISKEEYLNFLDSLNIVLTKSYISKKKFDIVEIPKWIYFVSFAVFLIFGVYLIIIYRAPRQSNGERLKNSAIILAFVGIGILFAMEIFCLSQKILPGKKLEEFYLPQFKEIIKEENTKVSPNMFIQFIEEEKYLLIHINKQENKEDDKKEGEKDVKEKNKKASNDKLINDSNENSSRTNKTKSSKLSEKKENDSVNYSK